jgi:hypothetical protein
VSALPPAKRERLDLALPPAVSTSRCRLDRRRDLVRLLAAAPRTHSRLEPDAITDFWLIASFNAGAMKKKHAAIIRHHTTVAVLLIKQFDYTDHCFTPC